jgi:hypothetical protein
MLRLYCVITRFKIDNGSFVCGSATQTKLSIVDPIHNAGIRLATGAFRTTWLES